MVRSSFKRLVGHTGRVTNVAWCPHMSLRLASSSYDGTVQVMKDYLFVIRLRYYLFVIRLRYYLFVIRLRYYLFVLRLKYILRFWVIVVYMYVTVRTTS